MIRCGAVSAPLLPHYRRVDLLTRRSGRLPDPRRRARIEQVGIGESNLIICSAADNKPRDTIAKASSARFVRTH
jgi:hypothetical protein